MKENKKAKKVVALLLCAVLLVVGSVSATVAYLTDSKSVTNTFTVGKVAITLDEAITDVYGVADGTNRAQTGNKYKLIPGHTYVKDPTITVEANSEDCYLFVKVVNGIKDYEVASGSNKTIAEQIGLNGWTKLDSASTPTYNVYYQMYTSQDTSKKVKVFENFEIAPDVNTEASTKDAWAAVTESNTKITITAYAVQEDGLNVGNAWNAVKDL